MYKNMDVEMLLKDNNNKLIFLKAVLLGINYGKSNEANYYYENIQNEINKLNQLNENNINDKEKNIYENNILLLENQKNNINQMIQKLSINYGFNHTKITILKNNLITIHQEIEKNKFLLKNKNNVKNINNTIFLNKNNVKNINNSIINKNNVNKNFLLKMNNNNNNNNYQSEFEKTLGNLSNFIIK